MLRVLVVVLLSFCWNIFCSFFLYCSTSCAFLADLPPPKHFAMILKSILHQAAGGELWGSSENSLIDLKRPQWLEILLLDRAALKFHVGTAFPSSSPQLTFLHFFQLHLPLFILSSLAFFASIFILCSLSRVFLSILPSYFLYSSQAFMTLFVVSHPVSYSFTITTIGCFFFSTPSCRFTVISVDILLATSNCIQ